jgi:hypothetical protein
MVVIRSPYWSVPHLVTPLALIMRMLSRMNESPLRLTRRSHRGCHEETRCYSLIVWAIQLGFHGPAECRAHRSQNMYISFPERTSHLSQFTLPFDVPGNEVDDDDQRSGRNWQGRFRIGAMTISPAKFPFKEVKTINLICQVNSKFIDSL